MCSFVWQHSVELAKWSLYIGSYLVPMETWISAQAQGKKRPLCENKRTGGITIQPDDSDPSLWRYSTVQ